MIKSILTATALVIAMTPVAAADSREEIEVTIAYNAAELTTEAGTKAVTRSIREQARDACQTNLSGSRVQRVDETCVAELVEAALEEISEQSAQG